MGPAGRWVKVGRVIVQAATSLIMAAILQSGLLQSGLDKLIKIERLEMI